MHRGPRPGAHLSGAAGRGQEYTFARVGTTSDEYKFCGSDVIHGGSTRVLSPAPTSVTCDLGRVGGSATIRSLTQMSWDRRFPHVRSLAEGDTLLAHSPRSFVGACFAGRRRQRFPRVASRTRFLVAGLGSQFGLGPVVCPVAVEQTTTRTSVAARHGSEARGAPLRRHLAPDATYYVLASRANAGAPRPGSGEPACLRTIEPVVSPVPSHPRRRPAAHSSYVPDERCPRRSGPRPAAGAA
jgi:hypothetical protein